MNTNIFELYPSLQYTLDNGESRQIVTDIFKRVILTKEFQDNVSYFEEYDVLDGETPEDVSYRFYDTQSLHWLILMTNNIIDPRFEWPLSEADLLKQVQSKYGTDKDIFTVNKAVNVKGYQVETYFVLTEESTHKNPIRLILEGIEDNGVNIPLAYKESNIGTDFQSNFEVEQLKNESYRRIKVLKPYIIQDILASYSTILNS